MDDALLLDADAVEQRLQRGLDNARASTVRPLLPSAAALAAAQQSLVQACARFRRPGGVADGAALVRHVLDDLVPALPSQAASSRYYGFVTGGVLPVAEWADNLVSRLDQNVQVHLPAQSIATAVEHATLGILAGLLRLDDNSLADENLASGVPCHTTWLGQTLTIGATASNVLGLACGREAILRRRIAHSPGPVDGTGDMRHGCVAELGLPAACAAAAVSSIQILTSAGHSSLAKAASVVGIGRRNVKELPRSATQPWRLDLYAVERELQRPGVASIIAVTEGDVNTGGFALYGIDEWTRLRELADRYGAWIHADGAFGIYARILNASGEYALLRTWTEGVEFADSITVDGHKVLNLPYDCGMFFTRCASTLQSVFLNPNAAYLSSDVGASIPSPLNVGLENSRRFRALRSTPSFSATANEDSSASYLTWSNCHVVLLYFYKNLPTMSCFQVITSAQLLFSSSSFLRQEIIR